MRVEDQKTAEFGDMVAAAFDGAAHYSGDPQVVAQLAAGAVSLMLRHMGSKQPSCRRREGPRRRKL